MAAHARAAGTHEAAAELFEGLHEPGLAAVEWRRTEAERQMYACELSLHPGWAPDVAPLRAPAPVRKVEPAASP